MKKIYVSIFTLSLIIFNGIGQNNVITSNNSLIKSRTNLNSEYAPVQSASNLQSTNKAMWTIQLDVDPTTLGVSLAGVMWTGTEFWCAKWNSADIYTADSSGTLTGNFTIPGVSGARSFTTDSTHIYIGAAGGSIYKIDPVTRTLVSTISTSVASCRYVTYDPTLNSNAGGFWTGAYGSDITAVSMTGTTLSTISSATHGLTGIYGMAYDNFSNSGPSLWAFNQGGADIIQLDMTGNPTGLTHDANSDLGTGGGLAGGLFICDNYFTGTTSMIGINQGESLFSYELYAGYENCVAPFGFSFSNLTSNSADLSWTGSANALSYNLEYGISGFAQGSGNFVNDTTNSFSFTGLLTSQEYDVYVQSLCDSSDSSSWVMNSFSTNPACGDSFGPYCYGAGSFTVFTVNAPAGDFVQINITAGETEVDYDNLEFYDGVGNSGNLLYSADGDHTGVSVLSTTGTISMYIDGDAIWNCDDGVGGPYTPIEATISCFTPPAIDIAATSITSPLGFIGINNAPFTVSGEFQNVGLNSVSSMDINYYDGSSVTTHSLSNLNINTGDFYIFNHPTTWTPASTGTYDISIWASNINGSNDMNSSNDTITETVNIVGNTTTKRVMLESFTSSTCAPCAPGNQNVASVLQGYQNNQYTILKYQADFPGTGDPYYTDEVGNRMTYYNVTGIPDLVVNGNEYQINSQSLTSQMVNNSIATPSFIDLSANYSVVGQVVDFEVTIDPFADFTNLTLHSAIFEYTTYNNTGTNGETEFKYVMKKMVPNSSGFNLNSIQDGVQRVENFSHTFNGNYILPPNANSPVNHAINHSVEDFDDLGVVVWIQNNVTKEILQSTNATQSFTSDEEKLMNSFKIFPNPSSNTATIVFGETQNNDVSIEVYNILGELVLSKTDYSKSNLGYYHLDVSTLNNGIYNLVLRYEDSTISKKLVIRK